MIHERKYLYGREEVDGILELDYLQTDLSRSDLRVDRTITITDDTQYRPDILSKVAFGSYHFGWYLMDYNNILDPYEELKTGVVLKIPNITEFFQWYSSASKISRKRK